MNTFIAFAVPTPATSVLRTSLKTYTGKLASSIPEEKWHITLVFLGNILLSPNDIANIQQPLHSAYLPTITILSIGIGKAEGQLWANIHATPSLIHIRQLLLNRLVFSNIPVPEQDLAREYMPHINLGNIETNTGTLVIPDTPAKVSFTVQEALVLRSTEDGSYERITTIPLVP